MTESEKFVPTDPQPEPAKNARGATPRRPSVFGRGLRRVASALLYWLVPIRKATDRDDGTARLVYTSFPKSFYFYIVWLPGFVSLILHSLGLASDTALVWTLIISAFLAYLAIAEDLELLEFALWVTAITLAVTLYRFGVIDFGWLRYGIDKLRGVALTFDRATIEVVTWGLFFYWCGVYLFSVTWRKRELSSNRRAKISPPRGKKIIPVVGRIVDNQLMDMLEFLLGFGAYDVVIMETSGRELDRDRNCVGLGLFINFFSDLVGRIATQEAGVHAAAAAAEASDPGV
ncbi:MAG: hypothetical protein AB7O52_17550 [Planctomycetota bacterium]